MISTASATEMLMEMEYPKDMPVAIIEKASHIDERQIFGKLHSISDIAKKNQVESPSTIVFGYAVTAI